VGKSTVVSKVILKLKSNGVIVGGCTTAEKRLGGRRVGFEVRDLTNERVGELSTSTGGLGPRVGRYTVNLTDLASVAARGLSDAAAGSELIVIDEVGPMELMSPDFRRAVRVCIDSGKPMLAVVHERLKDDLLTELREGARVLLVIDPRKRDEIAERLGDEILRTLGLPKAS